MSTPVIRLYYDGQCPLCRRQADTMRRRDRGRGRVELLDLTAPGFDPESIGLTLDELMGVIHGVTPDGNVVRGMEAFRLAYSAMGRGWLWAPTGWPVLRPIFDRAYRVLARHRPRLSGKRCADGRCAADPERT